jgi:hypothetical protein
MWRGFIYVYYIKIDGGNERSIEYNVFGTKRTNYS